MKAAVITFPGSNCDRDMRTAIQQVTGVEPYSVWHGDSVLPNGLDFIALPGGFSYGDYLRSGAIAAKSPIMHEVIHQAQKGVKILGICNGFQVLTESGLLPGVLMRNRDLRFICKTTELEIANNDSVFTKNYQQNRIHIPVAHHDGNYFIDEEGLKRLQDNQQIAFTYAQDNINGSLANIAGVMNEQKNILGMMPHPERAVDQSLGGSDGVALFTSLLESVA